MFKKLKSTFKKLVDNEQPSGSRDTSTKPTRSTVLDNNEDGLDGE